MEYTVRKATGEDLPRIQEIYARARRFMAENGNPNQWRNNHPPVWQLETDIVNGDLYVICADKDIHGVFYFYIGEDPTYRIIEGGQWRSDSPYGTIHRIAGDGSGGILGAAVKYGLQHIGHLRIDTHEDNHIMQKAVAKQGFQRRGIIYIADGSPRITYDLLVSKCKT